MSGSASAGRLADEARALGPWFHNLHLPHGVQTAPDHPYGDFPLFKWREIGKHIPRSLRGWRVLDVGCNGGFYSIELARRGARVLAIDHDPHYLAQARWAAQATGLQDRIEFREMPLYALARLPGRYDLVWFMGVLYHLRYPLLALDILRRKTVRLMVMQTLTMPDRDDPQPQPDDLPMTARARLVAPGWPRAAFIEHRLDGDPTNWWVPNTQAARAMLRASGFRVRGLIAHETWLCEPSADLPAHERALIEAELASAIGATEAASDLLEDELA